ncbi:MAG: 3'-5' exonuclease [Puniceicoccales bacterium]|nr:3'-5' exonuclease [Puniceicoccales bacterium]
MPHWKEIPIHVMDFEGGVRTGVVEYGVVSLLGGNIVGAQTRLCATNAPVPQLDTQCHGLCDADLANSPPMRTSWDYFANLRREGLFCAHHAPTEHGLLKAVWPYPGMMPDHAQASGTFANDWGPWLDTCRLAAAWQPRLGDYSLSALIEWFRLGKRLEQIAETLCPPHRKRYHCALYDALGAALLLRHLCSLPGRESFSLETLVRDSLSNARHADRIQGELDLG